MYLLIKKQHRKQRSKKPKYNPLEEIIETTGGIGSKEE
jgi:hypothetical protein